MSHPSFVQRFALAWRTFFRIVFDAEFAARILGGLASAPRGSLVPAERATNTVPVVIDSEIEAKGEMGVDTPAGPGVAEGALQILALLQREGRFVDFVKQDVKGFSDAQIGQAARVVHDGCRAALQRYVEIDPVIDEPEGGATTVPSGFETAAVKLVGNVSGSAPFRGTLRHRGWRAQAIHLPETLEDHVFEVLAPAEVEL